MSPQILAFIAELLQSGAIVMTIWLLWKVRNDTIKTGQVLNSTIDAVVSTGEATVEASELAMEAKRDAIMAKTEAINAQAEVDSLRAESQK